MRQAKLAEAIRSKRAEMIHLGMSKGLDSEETIYCSQELDDLLNEYNRILSQPKRFNPILDYIDYLLFLHKSTHRIVRLGYDTWGRF